jgi:spore germination protein GerM
LLETLYLTKDSAIVPVDRHVKQEPTAQTLLNDLIAGPTAAEQADGITSALPGSTVINSVAASNGLAVVTIGGGLEGAGRKDAILAFGQIVCTLDARPDVNGVVFVGPNGPIGVPRGDGSLTTSPLTTADYEDLLTRR